MPSDFLMNKVRQEQQKQGGTAKQEPTVQVSDFLMQKVRQEKEIQAQKQQQSAALDADVFISGVLEQLDKTKAQAQEADQAYRQAKSSYQPTVTGSSYAAAFQNQPAATQPATPYAAVQQDVGLQMSQEQKDLYKLRQEADALNDRVSALQDRATYDMDLRTIFSMPEDVRQALAAEAEATGTGEALRASPPEWYETAMEQLFGREWVTQNDMKAKSAAARETLAAAGYTDEQIKNLAETYTRFKNDKKAYERRQQTQQKVNSSVPSALWQNLRAFPANIVGTLQGGMGMAMEAVERGVEGSQYSSLDPNLEAYKLSQYASDVRSQTRENIEEGNGTLGKVGGVLYGATTSAVDNLARIAVAGPTGSLALAGLGSFQDSVRDVSDRGGNAMQAYGMGVATAAFEILTEKIPMEKLIDTPSPASLAQALKNAAIQGGIEMGTEELNFAATTIADALIMGEKSNIRQQYNELVASGKSHQEASRQVMNGLLLDAVNVAAESFLSGGMMSAGTQVSDYLSNRNKTATQQPQQAPQSEETPQTNTDAAPAVTAAQKDGSAQLPNYVTAVLDQLYSKQKQEQSAQPEQAAPAVTQEEAPKTVPNNAAGAESSSAADIAKMLLDSLRLNGNQQSKALVKQSAEDVAKSLMESIYKNQQTEIQTGKKRISDIAQTAKEAPSAAGDIAELIDTAKVNGDLSYYQIPNSVSTQKATEYITRKGWEQARMDWTAEVRSGRVSAETTAIGALLLNNAAKAGDKQTYLEVLKDFRAMGTNAAQATQAIRILKQLAPDDRLYMIQRSIDDIVDHARLPQAIVIPTDLKNQYVAAKTEEARNGVISKIQQYVADQLPSSLIEQFNALRYINMLGNFKTQGRNILGNLGMQIVSEAQNAICTGLEMIANKVSGGKYKRTRSVFQSSDLYKAARADFSAVEAIAMGGGKYEDKAADSFARGVQEKKTIFQGKILKPLEMYRRATNWAMEKGDEIFSKHSYARALAGYLKANGITAEKFSKMKDSQKDAARAFAVKEAQERTFRDSNRLSDWASKVGRRADTPLAVRMLAEGEAPFRKTAANVAVRAVEYSPLGLIDTIITGAKALNPKGEVTAQDFLNSASKTLTGAGIFMLGMILHNMGFLTGAPDDDEKQAGFDEAIGKQPYSLQFPDGTSYTFDWAAPLAIPLFMGAEWNKLREKQDIELEDIQDAALSLTAPLVNMTTLQTVEDISTKLMYADGDWGEVFLSIANGYLTQGLSNNLLGQIESSVQDVATMTYVDPESVVPEWAQRALGGVSQKIPGWDYQQVPYRDALGETEESGNLPYSLFSPGYLDKVELTAGRKERQRLADALGDTGVLYTTPTKTVNVGGEEYTMTAQEYDAVKEKQGALAENLVERMISHSIYDGLSDEQKAKAIKAAYKYATEKAKQDVISGADGFSDKWMQEIDDFSENSIVADILERYQEGEEKNETGLSDAQYEKAKEAGISTDAMQLISAVLDSITPEAGHERASLSQQMLAITENKDFSAEEKEDYLYWLLSDSQDKKLDAAKKLGLTAEEYAVAYSLYSTETNTGGKGTKDRIVSRLAEKFDIPYDTAEALYEIYRGTYDD